MSSTDSVASASGPRFLAVLRGALSGQVRWRILLLLFVVTVINFIDRQSLSVLAPVITRDLHLSVEQYSHAVMAFMIANGLIQLPLGPFLDRVGVKVGLALAVSIWSIGAGLQALTVGIFSLICFRVILGIGEGGNIPASVKGVGEWFPARERAFAMGVFNGGTAIGSMIAPPLIALVALRVGWRFAFLAGPLLSCLWLFFWWHTYRSPRLDELQPEVESAPSVQLRSPESGESTGILRRPWFWGIFAARAINAPVWAFAGYWLPLYLSQRYHFNLKQIGAFAWVPFLATDLGSMAGGAISGLLVRGNRSVAQARLLTVGVGSVMMFVLVPAAFAKWPSLAIALICVVMFAYGSFSANIFALSSDQFTKRELGRVASWTQIGSVLGGVAFTFFLGRVGKGEYWMLFCIAAALPILGYVSLLIARREDMRIS